MNITHALVYWKDGTEEATVMEIGTLIQCRNQLKNMLDWWHWLYSQIASPYEDVWGKWNTKIDDEGTGFSICGENWKIIGSKSLPQYCQAGDTVPIPK